MSNYSIIQKSQLEGAHRLDAEYYQPEYLENDQVIKKYKNSFRLLGDVLKRKNAITGGATPLGADYLDSGVPFLRVQNVMQNYLDLEDVVYISEDIHNGLLRRSRLKAGDVLLTITGVSYGKSATIPNDFREGNINQHSVKIEVDDNIILPEFLSTFLNSRFGKYQNDRKITGLSRPGLVYTELKNIIIPLIEIDKQRQIKDTIIEASETLKKSELFYSQAEELLLSEFGLKDFKVEDEISSLVNLSAIKLAHRMDAEYFQPKYNNLLEKLHLKKVKPLVAFISTYSTGFPFESYNYKNEGIPLIRINNIRRGYLDLNNVAYLTEDDYLMAPRDIAKPGDIVLSMSGTIGMAAIIPDDIPKSSINQRILRFTPKGIDKYYLTLVLNTIIGAYQLERIGTGGVQTNISYKDIKEILIPPLENIQQKIADLVRKSYESRKKAKELLEEAKRKVEKAIS